MAIQPAFDADIDLGPEGVVVRLSGDLDAAAASALRPEIDRWPLGASTVVDLSQVRFIDSTGIGVLLRLQQRVADAGGLLVARGVAPGVRRTLQICGVSRSLAIVD
jgi:anti-anti-sigma factor